MWLVSQQSHNSELYYRNLEANKITALKETKGLYNKPCKLNQKASVEIKWWKNNILNSFKNIHLPKIDTIIHTDASNLGWGITDGFTSSGGLWSDIEQDHHINVLELKAVYIGIVTLCKGHSFKHVKVMCDNTTAVAYINKKGGTK